MDIITEYLCPKQVAIKRSSAIVWLKRLGLQAMMQPTRSHFMWLTFRQRSTREGLATSTPINPESWGSHHPSAISNFLQPALVTWTVVLVISAYSSPMTTTISAPSTLFQATLHASQLY